ncbi:MAG: hypothetical protein ABI818_18905 [Acidobacteriota bacterium]
MSIVSLHVSASPGAALTCQGSPDRVIRMRITQLEPSAWINGGTGR